MYQDVDYVFYSYLNKEKHGYNIPKVGISLCMYSYITILLGGTADRCQNQTQHISTTRRKMQLKRKEPPPKKTARQRQDLHLCGRTQQISRSGSTFESVALTTVGKSGYFRFERIKGSNYLGHAVNFNNFGRNLCYLSSKYSAETSLGRVGIERWGDVLRFPLLSSSGQTSC